MEKKIVIRNIAIVILGIIVACAIGLGVFILVQGRMPQFISQICEGEKTAFLHTPYLGEAPNLTPPIAVAIENEIMARPFQVGLNQAQIVYEAPTEGGITRFLALYPADKYPEKVGPVRSARPYFLDWIHEYNAVYVHVGGSPEVLARLKKEKVFDADQYFNENYFWRENVGKTVLEHTMFTSGEKLSQLIKDKNWLFAKPSWQNSAAKNPAINWRQLPKASNILIDFGFPSYKVDYTYDEAAGVYQRLQAKKPHIDNSDKKQISAKMVIVQSVNARSLGDEKERISIKTIDKGNAVVFSKGRALEAKWEKTSLDEPTRFFDKNGDEIVFGSSSTWVEVVPKYNSFSFN